MKAHNVSLGLKIKVNNMALIQQKQISGLVGALAAKDAVTAVDSKDASILALASSSAGNLSVDSKDTSILALATDADADLSVDSKDTSILVAANSHANSAASTAESNANNYTDNELGFYDLSTTVDSKDDSVLVLAQGYANTAEANANNYTDTELGAYDLTTTVDSKDASILALASSSASNLSVDSKDTSILALATAADTAQSVDSKDTSILAAANAAATAADTAQSVDSKDTSVLAAAKVYTDGVVDGYFKDNVTPGYKLDLTATGNLVDPNNAPVGTYTVIDAAQGQGRLDLNVAIEGGSVTENEMNIIGIFINGVRLDQTEITVSTKNQVTIDAPYPFDENDSLEIRYNKEG